MSSPALTMTRIPDPAEPVPRVAAPTFILLVVSAATWFGSAAAELSGLWPWWISTLISAVASYLLFTVSHDAAHHAASSDSRLNTWMGRLSTPFFAPHASFPVWRFIHMQHHRFTNHEDGGDPDGYTMAGPAWQRPLRWATIDWYYLVFYARHLSRRPRGEKVEQVVQMAITTGIVVVAAATGHFLDLMAFYFLPCRIAIVYLAWAFDYLPHHGLHLTPTEDRLKTTRNRVGAEKLLSPILLYQNYHLVHHLHPVVPFYRYLAVWRRNEAQYLEGDPELTTVRGRPLTTDEYRRLRALAEHEH